MLGGTYDGIQDGRQVAIVLNFSNSWNFRKKNGQTNIKPFRCFLSHAYIKFPIIINNDLDKHIQAKTSDKRVRRFGDILAPLLREKDGKHYIAKKIEKMV